MTDAATNVYLRATIRRVKMLPSTMYAVATFGAVVMAEIAIRTPPRAVTFCTDRFHSRKGASGTKVSLDTK